MTAPAGWYPNPEDASQQRYWDGTAWTEHISPVGAPEPTIPLAPTPPPPPPPAPVAPPGATQPPAGGPQAWYLKKWVWITAAVFVALIVIGAVSGNNDTSPAADKQPAAVATVTKTPEPTATATATVTVTPTPSPTPPPPAATSAPPKPEPSAASGVGNNPTADGDTFTMPNEVGKILQVAQDDLQAVTGNPFFFTDSRDATGQDRMQILDSGWQVCSQKPKAGTRLSVDYEDIVFFVVRTSENCP